MRVILDTNVFISGIFFSGPPYQILKAWKNGKIKLVVSYEILDEYQRVGEELSNRFNDIEIGPFIELLLFESEIIDTSKVNDRICSDPDDDKFIHCALAGKCKFIISGDTHLKAIDGYKKIKVLSPRRFVEQYLSNK